MTDGRIENDVVTNLRVTGTEGFRSAFGAVSQVASGFGSIIGRVTSLFNPLNLAIGGISTGYAVQQISQLGSEFEQTQQVLAGTLSALGFAAGADPTARFRNGLDIAADTMDQIQAAAAALPGEAEDYLSVFRAALPEVAGAMDGNLTQMTEFTNRLTAIGRSFGIDAMQIGHDVQRMLRTGTGGAGMQVRTWTQLLPFIHTVEGQANLTADAFNRMTSHERLHLLEQTFERLQPMLDQAGSTFDSMWGAMVSTTRQMTRMATSPIFDAIKDTMGDVNALFMSSSGEMTDLGRSVVSAGQGISRLIVRGIEQAVRWVGALRDSFDQFSEAVQQSPMFTTLSRIVDNLAGVARTAQHFGASGAAGMAGAAVGVGAAAAAGPGALIFAPLIAGFSNFLTRTDEVVGVLNLLAETVDILTSNLDPMVTSVVRISEVMGDLWEHALPDVITGFNQILEPLMWFGGEVFTIVNTLVDHLQPTFEELWSAVGDVMDAFGSAFGPGVRESGGVLLVFARIISSVMVPVIQNTVRGFSMLLHAIASFMRFIGQFTGATADALGIPEVARQQAEGSGILEDILSSLRASTDAATARDSEAATAAARQRSTQAPGARGGTHVHQDFRGSRFDISQRFAEGFDPDRVATALVSDIETAATHRLQSGLEPIFGVT